MKWYQYAFAKRLWFQIGGTLELQIMSEDGNFAAYDCPLIT